MQSPTAAAAELTVAATPDGAAAVRTVARSLIPSDRATIDDLDDVGMAASEAFVAIAGAGADEIDVVLAVANATLGITMTAVVGVVEWPPEDWAGGYAAAVLETVATDVRLDRTPDGIRLTCSLPFGSV